MSEWSKERYAEVAEVIQDIRDDESIDIDYEQARDLDTAVSMLEDAMPRIAGDYRIQHAVHIGDKEIVFGVNSAPTEEAP